MSHHLSTVPAPLASCAAVPDAFGAVIDRLLAKAPDERFPSGGALAEALEAL
jgi:hypothetical protein